MIRYILFSTIMLASSAAYSADLNTTLLFNSNYIYKGLSFTNGGPLEPASTGTPAVQGSIDLTHDNFGWTIFTGNVKSWDAITSIPEPDIELDSMMYLVLPLDQLTVQVNINNFNYIINPINNIFEVSGKILFQEWRLALSASSIPGWNTELGYAQLAYSPQLTEAVGLTSHVGYNTISTTDWGYGNYVDYKLGISHSEDGWYTELYYTNTLGRTNYLTNSIINTDGALTLTVAKTFTVFSTGADQ